MSNPIPDLLALTSIPDGSQRTASPLRNNYSAIQTAVNDLIAALSGGAAGQVLQAVDGSGVTWAAALPAPLYAAPPLTPTGFVAWSANTAIFSRFYLPVAKTVTSFEIAIGTQSGNIDIGVYADNGSHLPGAKLWSRGGIACPAAGRDSILISAGSPTTLTLPAGTYWIAIAVDNATVTIPTVIAGAAVLPKGLTAVQASAYPLPANAAASVNSQGIHAVLL